MPKNNADKKSKGKGDYTPQSPPPTPVRHKVMWPVACVQPKEEDDESEVEVVEDIQGPPTQRHNVSTGISLPVRQTICATVAGASHLVQNTQVRTSQDPISLISDGEGSLVAGRKRKCEEPEMVWIDGEVIWIR
ncbi:hypothetical protein PILCRDRAFT_10747 [Piloderma croceum F 1598]|uniref:Uncharacterized protein n=1 Tax=Piloderma croceum (strain F 1598) TaxID=765440 RepID=A0A0C3FH73_PILCF|nr:hypothetical protein PILCRDRAFT_10747 [Piloderma croceum F 1598]